MVEQNPKVKASVLHRAIVEKNGGDPSYDAPQPLTMRECENMIKSSKRKKCGSLYPTCAVGDMLTGPYADYVRSVALVPYILITYGSTEIRDYTRTVASDGIVLHWDGIFSCIDLRRYQVMCIAIESPELAEMTGKKVSGEGDCYFKLPSLSHIHDN